jgi:predicted small integral membrane protein
MRAVLFSAALSVLGGMLLGCAMLATRDVPAAYYHSAPVIVAVCVCLGVAIIASVLG